jgi:hypothetical protein
LCFRNQPADPGGLVCFRTTFTINTVDALNGVPARIETIPDSSKPIRNLGPQARYSSHGPE